MHRHDSLRWSISDFKTPHFDYSRSFQAASANTTCSVSCVRFYSCFIPRTSSDYCFCASRKRTRVIMHVTNVRIANFHVHPPALDALTFLVSGLSFPLKTVRKSSVSSKFLSPAVKSSTSQIMSRHVFRVLSVLPIFPKGQSMITGRPKTWGLLSTIRISEDLRYSSGGTLTSTM